MVDFLHQELKFNTNSTSSLINFLNYGQYLDISNKYQLALDSVKSCKNVKDLLKLLEEFVIESFPNDRDLDHEVLKEELQKYYYKIRFLIEVINRSKNFDNKDRDNICNQILKNVNYININLEDSCFILFLICTELYDYSPEKTINFMKSFLSEKTSKLQSSHLMQLLIKNPNFGYKSLIKDFKKKMDFLYTIVKDLDTNEFRFSLKASPDILDFFEIANIIEFKQQSLQKLAKIQENLKRLEFLKNELRELHNEKFLSFKNKTQKYHEEEKLINEEISSIEMSPVILEFKKGEVIMLIQFMEHLYREKPFSDEEMKENLGIILKTLFTFLSKKYDKNKVADFFLSESGSDAEKESLDSICLQEISQNKEVNKALLAIELILNGKIEVHKIRRTTSFVDFLKKQGRPKKYVKTEKVGYAK